MIKNIKKELKKYIDEKYKIFSSSLIPNSDNILGVRLPILRKIASKINKKDYETFFKENDDEYIELTLLEGILISKLDFNEQLKYLDFHIKKINNWETCDTFCNDLKTFKNRQEEIKKIIEKYINSENEYEVRFCYVILLMYFIDENYTYVIEKIKQFKHNKYYAKMSVAWCISYCFIKNFDKTLNEINKMNIDSWTKNKAITKAIESFKIDRDKKEKLKLIRNITK